MNSNFLGVNQAPYLIAEIGMNHEGSLEVALEMLEKIAKAGWHAAKFQSYDPDKLASKSFSDAYWDTNEESETSQHSLFSRLRKLSVEDYAVIIERCHELSIDFLTTPFDEEHIAFFSPKMRFVKIASADITNIPLIEQVAAQGKPIILSCGAANFQEVRVALDTAMAAGASEIALMHCVLNYPTRNEDAHLNGILELKDAFPEHIIGYSDHTKFLPGGGPHPASVAVAMGAQMVEKHFTLNRGLPGNDHYHAADPGGLDEIRREIDAVIRLQGSGIEAALSQQHSARKNARRRIFTKSQVKPGQLLEESNLIPLRSSRGIEVALWREVVGSIAKTDIEANHPVEWSNLQQ